MTRLSMSRQQAYAPVSVQEPGRRKVKTEDDEEEDRGQWCPCMCLNYRIPDRVLGAQVDLSMMFLFYQTALYILGLIALHTGSEKISVHVWWWMVLALVFGSGALLLLHTVLYHCASQESTTWRLPRLWTSVYLWNTLTSVVCFSLIYSMDTTYRNLSSSTHAVVRFPDLGGSGALAPELWLLNTTWTSFVLLLLQSLTVSGLLSWNAWWKTWR